jgi:predicted anti-sigma-YlaC factor YlaD
LDFEKLIALDVEGDLPERKAAKLGEHLKACRNCREFAEKLQASQAVLKSLAQEAMDEAMLREVRRRVLGGIATEAAPHRFLAWRFALGAALVATVILAAITLWRPRGHGVSESTREVSKQPRMVAVQPAPTAPEHPRVRTEKAKRVLQRRKQPQGPLAASVSPPPAGQLRIKLVTDDPNVVIYWLVD